MIFEQARGRKISVFTRQKQKTDNKDKRVCCITTVGNASLQKLRFPTNLTKRKINQVKLHSQVRVQVY